MNERINTQDLVDLLAVRHSVSKKEAEAFIKEFFLLIEQGLDKDRSVKIKGLGTFKLIGIESRESINVNTGERFLIEGHTKVSFTPDNGLREVINRPFSHFETVVLHENTVLPDTPIESLKEEAGEQEVPVSVDHPVFMDEGPEAEVFLSSSEELSPDAAGETVVVAELEISSAQADVSGPVEGLPSQELTSSLTEEERLPEIAIDAGSVEVPVEDSIREVSQDRVWPEEEGPAAEEETEITVKDEEQNEISPEKERLLQDQELAVTPDLATGEPDTAIPPVTQSFASPSRKRLTAEEIITLEIQKADEEYRRSVKIPFLPRSEKKEKKEIQKEEGKSPAQKKETNRRLQRCLIAVVFLVLLGCGGLLLYNYMPDWLERNMADRLALEKTVEDPATTGWQEDAVEENPQELTEGEISDGEPLEEVPIVNERIADTPVRETPVRPEQPAVSEQTTAILPASDKEHRVPENIASIPVRPDSVNYVIVGTKTTHKIEEGETLTKVAYRFYGTKDLWPYIVMHNQTVIRNPNHVPFGTTIRIPELEKK